MGACAPSKSFKYDQFTDEIERQLLHSEKQEKQTRKIVLLGTRSSGKSTLLKQLEHIHSWGDCLHTDGTDDTEKLKRYAHVIRKNLISSMHLLLHQSYQLYTTDSSKFSNCLIEFDNDANIRKAIRYVIFAKSQISMTEEKAYILVFGYIRSYENELKTFVPSEISPMICSFYWLLFEQQYDDMKTLGECIKQLWDLPAIQNTYAVRNKRCSFPANMDYYFSHARVIFDPDFEPNTENRLKCDCSGTGLNSIESKYIINDIYFNILCYNNYSSSRHARSLFDGTTAVIFVAALNHYNKVSFTDNNKNAMHESIELFDQVVNSKWFRKTDVILFLNKEDLFRDSLMGGQSLRECFSFDHCGWEGDQWDTNTEQQSFEKSYQIAIRFIQDQYVNTNLCQYKRVFVHTCNATSTDSIQKVFWDVQNIVIRSNLKMGS